jgi:hypothetical protein
MRAAERAQHAAVGSLWLVARKGHVLATLCVVETSTSGRCFRDDRGQSLGRIGDPRIVVAERACINGGQPRAVAAGVSITR